MDNIDIDINNKSIIVIDPEQPINTAEAYQNILPNKSKYQLKHILENENIENWSKYIKNDFEDFAFKKVRELKKIKSLLLKLGADYISLSGSGSCIYGIYNNHDINQYDFPYKSFKVKIIE